MDTKTMNVIALVGTYRKNGVVDSAVDVILETLREHGATTTKVYLMDKQIEFCANCRACTQTPGVERGACPIQDDMFNLLDEIARADGLILASPMNFGTVTAVMKRFIERLICFAYWPWEVPAPKARNSATSKPAIIVTSSAAPAIAARLTTKIVRLLKQAASLLSAETKGVLFIGMCAQKPSPTLSPRTIKKAQQLAEKLIQSR